MRVRVNLKSNPISLIIIAATGKEHGLLDSVGHGNVCEVETEAGSKVTGKLIDALIWCSAASDFAPGGKARKGWVKSIKPLLDKHKSAV